MTGQELKILLDTRKVTPLMLAYKLGVSVPTVYSLLKKDEVPKLYVMAIKRIFSSNFLED